MGILDFIQEELAKTKKSLGLIGGIKLANDPKVKELSDFERKMYEKSLIYQSLKDAVTAPSRAYKGELDPWSQEAIPEAMNVAGMATLGGFPGGARGPGSVGATVWHGSPHKFDKFDMSKIGTGEGAQAYGHGLYFAESPDVAKSYQKMGSPTLVSADQIATYVSKGQSKKDALAEMRGQRDHYKSIGDNDTSNKYREAIRLVKNNEQPSEFGHTYKVDIPDESIPRMLDWDKPLSEQSESVRNALAKSKNKQVRAMLEYAQTPYSADIGGEQKTMGEAFRLLNLNLHGRSAADSANASALLAKQGIPGIRYLDGGSRTAGEGTSNYVLFDDQLPRILERNGEPTGLQPWAPGEANALLGLPPAAPMRPRNALGQEIPPTPYELAHAEAQRVAAILAQPNEAKAK